MENGKRNFGLLDENFFQIVIISIDMVVPMVVQQKQKNIQILIIFTINRQRDIKKVFTTEKLPTRTKYERNLHNK